MKAPTLALPLLAVALAGLAGCATAAPTHDMAGMTGTPAPAAAPVAADTVAIQNFAFTPGTVSVKAGSTVTWTNQDQDPHTVTSANGGPLKSPTLNKGDSYRYTFTTAGRYDYLCTIHPFMTATVVVTP